MPGSGSNSSSPFRAIYVEDSALTSDFTRRILEKYDASPQIGVRSYRDVFMRPRQDFRTQKENPALLLAVKEPPFLYAGPEVCQDFDADLFFYATLLLNCPFACDYCYLQGMFPSGNLVAFVNAEDVIAAIRAVCRENDGKSVLIALSYDTDLLAFDEVLPYLDALYEGCADLSNLTLEIRTKSASTRFVRRYAGRPGPFTIAYSLAPEEVIRAYEKRTPSLDTRLRAAAQAADFGFPIRLCFDPVFIDPRFDDLYEPFYRHVFETLPVGAIRDASHGFFRMGRDFFRRVRRKMPGNALFLADYPNRDPVTFDPEAMHRIREKHLSVLYEYLPKERIFCV